MSQISNSNIEKILDLIARHAAETNGDILASAITTGGVYTETAPNSGLSVANADCLAALDADVLNMADPALTRIFYAAVDALALTSPSPAALLNAIFNRPPYPGAPGLLDALDAYALDPEGGANAMGPSDRGGLDAMLRILNASSPTVRAHELFAAYLGRLSPGNVFTGRPYVLGSIACSGATAGTLTLSGYKGNTGLLDVTRFGAGQVAIRNTKGGGEGGSAVVITLMVVKSGVAAQKAFTTGAATLDELTAATGDTTKTITGLSGTGGAAGAGGCALVSISNATDADTYDVVILPDRTINAAS